MSARENTEETSTATAKRKKHQISISDYFTKRRKMSSAENNHETAENRRELLASAAEKRHAEKSSSVSLMETEAERRLAVVTKEPIGNNIVRHEKVSEIRKNNDKLTVSIHSTAQRHSTNSEKPNVKVELPTHFQRLTTNTEYHMILTPTNEHTILFRPHILPNKVPKPFPDKYRDHWDKDHVRMPCSPENLYPTLDKKVQKRWELIETTLLQPFQTSKDLEEAILVYNHHYKEKWNFEAWHSYCNIELNHAQREDLFTNILPNIVNLALQLPNIVTQSPILLQRGKDHRITMSQQQVACLLANAFFCTFPRRNSLKSSEYCNYPDINFSRMFRGIKDVVNTVKTEKLKCILNYFQRVLADMPTGTVTFHRKVLSDEDNPTWEKSDAEFCDLYVTSQGTIEDDGEGLLQVDFANRMIGGGVVGEGCVQEEIRFLMCPEMIVARLFTEKLDANESLLITGAERYSSYTGYAQSFRFAGNYNDFTRRDRWGRRYVEVIAIDAHVFHCYTDQIKSASLKRELDKAYCGFMRESPLSEKGSDDKSPYVPNKSHPLPGIATGNWGCGAFGGDVRLKSLIQLMAAGMAKRETVYFTFFNEHLTTELTEMHAFLRKNKVTIGKLWNYLLRYGHELKSSTKEPVPLFPYIRKLHESYETDTDDGASSCNEDPLEVRGVPCEIPPDMSPVSPDYEMDTP